MIFLIQNDKTPLITFLLSRNTDRYCYCQNKNNCNYHSCIHC